MTDNNDSVKKDTLKVANPGRLQLTKTVESGKVKQSFTHGRSKSVTVEVRKTRTFTQGTTSGTMVEVKANAGAFGSGFGDDDSMRHLTLEERQSRLKALKVAEEHMKIEADLAAKRRDEDKHARAMRGESEESEAVVEVEEKPVVKVSAPVVASNGIVTPIKQQEAKPPV